MVQANLVDLETPNVTVSGPQAPGPRWTVWIIPVLTLMVAYGLLFLTMTTRIGEDILTKRCVLTHPQYARIWSVGNIEIGLAYLGVFGAMLFYFLKIYRNSVTHLRDLTFALCYLFGSFFLDYICVKTFDPFVAMLIGDGMVMTFTMIVSRQVWFQRLLGVFVPLIFLTCGIGHFLEGLSYWQLTYELNVPWTMVTADVGFAVLVNASRYPAFIRGEDILNELTMEKSRAHQLIAEVEARKRAEAENVRLMEELQHTSEQQRLFLRDVLASVTEGHLRFCESIEDMPVRPNTPLYQSQVSREGLKDLRGVIARILTDNHFPLDHIEEAQMAVHEGAMNALVHGNGGVVTVFLIGEGDDQKLQTWVEDQGKGIDIAALPRATLEAGYSSAGTLGQGFKMMIRTADTVWMRTNQHGTTIVIEKGKKTPQWLDLYSRMAIG